MGCKQDTLEGSIRYTEDNWVYTAIVFGIGFPYSLFLLVHYFKTKGMKKYFHSSAVHIYQVAQSECELVNLTYTACMEMVNQNKKVSRETPGTSACA